MGERFKKFSSWKCLRKSIAWAIRYVKQLHEIANKQRRGEAIDILKTRARNPQPLRLEELETADKFILSTVQQSNFQDELSTLQEKIGSVKRASSINKLSPEIIDGLLCVGGRLTHAPLENTAKHQVILPKHHHVSTLIVRYYHQCLVTQA